MSNKNRQSSNVTAAEEQVVTPEEPIAPELAPDVEVEGMPIDELDEAITDADAEEKIVEDEAALLDLIPNASEEETVKQEDVEEPEVKLEEEDGEPDVETPNVEMATVKEILMDKTLTGVAKLEMIATHDIPKFKFLALKLINYATTMSRSNTQNNPTNGAAANFDLYNIISNVINDEDYGSFKTSFDIVNLAFKEYNTDAYNDIMLHRFSVNWTWSEEYYATFLSLATIISTLCNPVTRAATIKSLDLSKAFNSKKQRFSQKAIENISRYYKAK